MSANTTPETEIRFRGAVAFTDYGATMAFTLTVNQFINQSSSVLWEGKTTPTAPFNLRQTATKLGDLCHHFAASATDVEGQRAAQAAHQRLLGYTEALCRVMDEYKPMTDWTTEQCDAINDAVVGVYAELADLVNINSAEAAKRDIDNIDITMESIQKVMDCHGQSINWEGRTSNLMGNLAPLTRNFDARVQATSNPEDQEKLGKVTAKIKEFIPRFEACIAKETAQPAVEHMETIKAYGARLLMVLQAVKDLIRAELAKVKYEYRPVEADRFGQTLDELEGAIDSGNRAAVAPAIRAAAAQVASLQERPDLLNAAKDLALGVRKMAETSKQALDEAESTAAKDRLKALLSGMKDSMYGLAEQEERRRALLNSSASLSAATAMMASSVERKKAETRGASDPVVRAQRLQERLAAESGASASSSSSTSYTPHSGGSATGHDDIDALLDDLNDVQIGGGSSASSSSASTSTYGLESYDQPQHQSQQQQSYSRPVVAQQSHEPAYDPTLSDYLAAQQAQADLDAEIASNPRHAASHQARAHDKSADTMGLVAGILAAAGTSGQTDRATLSKIERLDDLEREVGSLRVEHVGPDHHDDSDDGLESLTFDSLSSGGFPSTADDFDFSLDGPITTTTTTSTTTVSAVPSASADVDYSATTSGFDDSALDALLDELDG